MRTGPRLLVRLGSMGDVVLATAAATAWKQRLGDEPLDVLVKSEWAPLWEGHPAVGQVHAWRAEDRGTGGVLAYARRLKRGGYVEALDLQGSPRTRAVLALAGIDSTRSRGRYAGRRRNLVRFKRWGPPEGFSVLRSFLDGVGADAEALPSLHPGAAARERAAALLQSAGSNPVGLVPGARHQTKRWPVERFVAVGRKAVAAGRGVLVFFGPDEAALREAWVREWPQADAWVSVRESLPTTAAVLEGCSRVLCGDTGLMHMAAAMGTPVTALFGPTVTAFGFRPSGPGHRVIQREVSCRPCSVHGTSTCPRDHFRCMLETTPEAVCSVLFDGPAL